MKIVITDSGILWRYGNPILKNYKDLVLVVCLHGSRLQMNMSALYVHKGKSDLV